MPSATNSNNNNDDRERDQHAPSPCGSAHNRPPSSSSPHTRRDTGSDTSSGSNLTLLATGAVFGVAAMGLYNYFFPPASSPSLTSSNALASPPGSTATRGSRLYTLPRSGAALSSAQGIPPKGDTLSPSTNTCQSFSSSGIDSGEASTVQCVICMDQPSVMLFTECGHLCCCEACVHRMATDAGVLPGGEVRLPCPQCRTCGPLQRVYLP